MRSSAQRASANIGRRAQTTSGAGVQPGPIPTRRQVSLLSPTDDNVARAGREYDDTARDTAFNTELNKVNSECDRYKARLEQVSKKLLETQQQKDELKEQRDEFKQQRESYKSQLQVAKKENASLLNKLEDFQSANLELAAKYEEMMRQHRDLEERYNTLASSGSAGSTGSHAASSALPDRTRSSYRPSGKDHHEDRGYKGRSREGSREAKESKEPRGYSEYMNQCMEFQAAEKERLKGRFEDKSSTASSSIKTRGSSFIEGWGPGPGLEQPVVPPSRMPPGQVPAMLPAFNGMPYSTVPRTHAHMYNPNTAALYGADGEYESGCKYQPYPVAR
ncbi:hypothetical protein J3458_000083 [Metarhizium acridum]|uniref:Uncharacterized protein n=1 Tax=Metarhizium acridum (strain CQMa 102) TaxID=655827 RepID=E9DRZ3_METAQ|nr:uncharacterized protein MAC_00066 [Metarhizium acridum CQMa 102]EFY93575.1 hypothetical protein MAC_00066 [Metarhizium acridum CQMa 102]KAG8423168.1 hypothetical protein J3458_000083 [Metarhizium acridum]